MDAELSALARAQTACGPVAEELRGRLRLAFEVAGLSVACRQLGQSLPLLRRFPSLASHVSGAVKTLREDPEDAGRRLYLCAPDVDLDSLDVEQQRALEKLRRDEGLVVSQHRIILDYTQLTYRQVFEMTIPEALIPTSFEQVGHLVHFNLKEPQLPYRFFIGAVIVDKVATARTVVNKVGTIENEFRVLPMECIGGEEDYLCQVSEQGCRYLFDFSRVYWNTRLAHEHERVVSSIPEGTVVADVFGGVGPFALPLAVRRGCRVHVNDLNPASYEALVKNIAGNKVSHLVSPYNLDGRDFIRAVAVHHPQCYIMNLPAISISFLDALADSGAQEWRPRVYLHCFSRGQEDGERSSSRQPWSLRTDVVLRILRVLHGVDVASALPAASVAADGASVEYTDDDPRLLEEACAALERRYFAEPVVVHAVRSVSPHKTMCCAQFVLALPDGSSPPAPKQSP